MQAEAPFENNMNKPPKEEYWMNQENDIPQQNANDQIENDDYQPNDQIENSIDQNGIAVQLDQNSEEFKEVQKEKSHIDDIANHPENSQEGESNQNNQQQSQNEQPPAQPSAPNHKSNNKKNNYNDTNNNNNNYINTNNYDINTNDYDINNNNYDINNNNYDINNNNYDINTNNYDINTNNYDISTNNYINTNDHDINTNNYDINTNNYDINTNNEFNIYYANTESYGNHHQFYDPVQQYQAEMRHNILYGFSKPYRLSDQDKFRQKIAQHNHEIVKTGKYQLGNMWIYVQPILRTSMNKTKTYHFAFPFNLPPLEQKYQNVNPIIHIVPLSTFEAVNELYNKYPDKEICCLNFANAIKPGGGYLNGRTAQEEQLCRQSLLYPTLTKNLEMYQFNIEQNLHECGSNYMIYSPLVLFFRDDEFNLIPEPFAVNVITSPAVDNRNRLENAHSLMRDRIIRILELAAYHENRVLVLGAFGCGVFKNDPYVVAKLFKEAINMGQFRGRFDCIYFAIYRSDRNVSNFRQVFYR